MAYLINYLEQSGILELLSSPDILIMLAMICLLWIASWGRSKKSQRTNAQLADNRVKYNLARTASRQLKKFNIKRVCLYSGSFENWELNPFVLWFKTYLWGQVPCVFVPNANPGIEIIGAPGEGKTFSAIDRLLASAIEQGFPIVLYDYKGGPMAEGGQIPFIATLAARHGYKVRIFAPGQNYSCTINPLDFIKDSSDISMAQTLAKTFQANLRGDSGRTDGFFGPAGEKLLYASFLLAKKLRYPDLAMAFAILSLPELGKRLAYAKKNKTQALSVWDDVTFSQFLSVADSAETGGGILAQAQDIAGIFIQADLLPCLMGQTNVSLDLKSKEILLFQSDEERHRVMNPLIAGIIETLVNRNFSHQRKCPLVLSLDEYPTLTIEQSVHWPNRHRSKGLIMIAGYQSKPQLVESYGKNKAEIFRGGLKNRFLFNPQNEETQKEWSELIGKKEIKIENSSRSPSKGGFGSQKSVSEQSLLTSIMNSDDLRSMQEGECIYVNSQSKLKKRGYIPWHIPRIKVSKKDQKLQDDCEAMWSESLIHKITAREDKHRANYDVEQELRNRFTEAERLFPLPAEAKSEIDTRNFM